ncbi:hypothetical protein ZWY2020_034706 [Hordeum vulgare]|nr:hypothetical protein ZWY2020_034706 [Hordeum vulgare]
MRTQSTPPPQPLSRSGSILVYTVRRLAGSTPPAALGPSVRTCSSGVLIQQDLGCLELEIRKHLRSSE